MAASTGADGSGKMAHRWKTASLTIQGTAANYAKKKGRGIEMAELKTLKYIDLGDEDWIADDRRKQEIRKEVIRWAKMFKSDSEDLNYTSEHRLMQNSKINFIQIFFNISEDD